MIRMQCPRCGEALLREKLDAAAVESCSACGAKFRVSPRKAPASQAAPVPTAVGALSTDTSLAAKIQPKAALDRSRLDGRAGMAADESRSAKRGKVLSKARPVRKPARILTQWPGAGFAISPRYLGLRIVFAILVFVVCAITGVSFTGGRFGLGRARNVAPVQPRAIQPVTVMPPQQQPVPAPAIPNKNALEKAIEKNMPASVNRGVAAGQARPAAPVIVTPPVPRPAAPAPVTPYSNLPPRATPPRR